MLSFFKPATVKPDLSFIGVDMHSHLLPGIDDGLKTLDETIRFISELEQLGYTKLICTPHIISDIHPNSAETILPKLELVRNALKEKKINITIEAAAEYMVDIDMEKEIKSGRPLLTFGRNLILIEMSYVAPSPNMERVVFHLRMSGLHPVIAHPERYAYYHHNFEIYERFADMGCYLQVNLLSLLGYYGKPVKIAAEKMIKNNMVDLLGTDIHHERHLDGLKELASKKEFYKMFEGINIRNNALLLKPVL